MITRVTQQSIQSTTLANLQGNLTRMADLQAQLSSGRLVTRASDDPNAATRAMAYRAERAATEQAARNAADGEAWLGQIDTTLQSSVATLRRARDLTVQAANTGTMGPASREAIASELEALRDNLLDQANTTLNGRLIFAGTSGADEAFDATTFAWNGTPGADVTRRLGAAATVKVDADGSAAYGSGAGSVFQLLGDIAAEVRSGAQVSARLDDLDVSLEAMQTTLSSVGARANQVSRASTTLAHRLQDLTAQISTVEDIDIAQSVMELQMQEVAYQGALGAAGRVLQPTLLDFLR